MLPKQRTLKLSGKPCMAHFGASLFPTVELDIICMASYSLSFEDWKKSLRRDCQRNGAIFDCFCKICLAEYWELGIEPSLRAISKSNHPFGRSNVRLRGEFSRHFIHEVPMPILR